MTLLPLLCCLLFWQGPPQHTDGDMVGEVTARGAVLWTRASRAAKVEVFVSTSSNMSNPRRFGPVSTDASFAARVPVTGLAPGRRHWFYSSLIDPGRPGSRTNGPVGSFSTAPATAARVRFVFASDVIAAATAPVFRDMRAQAADFFVAMGDMPYVDWTRQATTLAEFRSRYHAVRSIREVIDFFRTTPCYPMFDDHEVTNDWDRSTRPALVATGLRVWQEWLPYLPPSPGVFYRSHAWGTALRIFLLDTRSRRGRNDDPDGPSHAMLGPTQLAWVEQGLAAAKETFKVVCSTVPLRSGTKGRDHWAGYQYERRALFDFIGRHGIRNVVFLSGDHHFAAVNHHPEGFVEVLTTAVNAGARRAPADRDEAMVQAGTGLGYGLVTVDPAANPPVLTVEVRSGRRVLVRQRVEARAPGRVELLAGLGDAEFHLTGPRSRRFAGSFATYPLAAGDYVAHAGARAGRRTLFPSRALHVAAGGFASFGILPPITAPLARARLLADDFEGSAGTLPKGASVLDAAGARPPSSWFLDGGRLWQASRIRAATSSEPGTRLTLGDAAWTDQEVRVRVRSWGGGSIGVLFRYQDPSNYYWFTLDAARASRRLVLVRGGRATLLAGDTGRLPVYQWVDLRCSARGKVLSVHVDGQRVFQVADPSLARGAVGLTSSGTGLVAFDRLRVRSAPPGEGIVVEDHFAAALDRAWTVHDQGTGKSAWRTGGGRLLQTGKVSGPGQDRPGTLLVRTDRTLAGASLSVTMTSRAGRGIGALLRVASPKDYYRFQMDAGSGWRRLERVAGGVHALLAEDRSRGYEPGRRYRVELLALGDRLSVRLDGAEVLAARDATIAQGGIGLYTFADDTAAFDDVVLRAIGGDAPATTVEGGARTFLVTLHASQAAGDIALFLLSDRLRPPADLSALDPGRRLGPLHPGWLFWQTVGLGMARRFDAGGDAQVRLGFPASAALSGLRIFAGGFRIRPSGAVLPLATAPIRF